MPTVNTPAGALHYRVVGPEDSTAPAVVFVHGFLVDSTLWDPVAGRLADAGVRSYLIDWPLGSHRSPMRTDADLSPLGVAMIVNDALAALDLADVTLVGNDTGGAVCQLLLASDATRIGRLVLTNCDAFENFPPTMFVPLFIAAKRPWLTKFLLAPMRLRVMRHSPMAYGMLLRKPRNAELTRNWVTPALTNPEIRNDIARFARGVDRHSLVTAAARLRDFDGPVRVVWGAADRCFTLDMARRLVAAFADATLVEVADVSTFVPIDRPEAVANAIVSIATADTAK
jgi:pimeloyl-ACP methyl ester carboxylesterase